MTETSTEVTFSARTEHAAPAARGERLPITQTRRLVLGELPSAERRDLCARAYALYAAYKTGVDRATFERAFFADDRARVATFHGKDGAFAGFAAASLHRVTHEGKEHAVYSALLFIDARYKGTREASLFALVEALKFKLREPLTPLAYMGVTTSPASYRMFSVTMPAFYPMRGVPVPPRIDSLVRAAARARGLSFIDGDRWLVRGMGAPRHPERLRTSRTLRGNPDVDFYLEQNPQFEDGTALLLWVPLTLRNVCGALVRRVFGQER
ncbi:MAG: hypothetical protein QM820_34165 [Minicystis sp.]